MPAPTVEDLLAELGNPAESADVATRLDIAVEYVERKCGPLTPREIISGRLTAQHGVIALPIYPVVSVDGVTTRPEGVTVDTTGWDVDLETGIIRGVPTGTYTVTYTAGWAVTPQPLRLAVLLLASHLWETRRGRASRPFTHGGGEIPAGTGFAVPRRVTELMHGYLISDGPP